MKTIKRNVALIICLVFLGTLCGCSTGQQSEASEALKEYFDACNEMDMDAIHNASIPAGKEGYYSASLLSEDDYSFFQNWRTSMGFARSKLDLADFVRFNPKLVIFEDYPYVNEGENGELLNYDGEKITLKEALPDFEVNYTVEKMEQFGDCTVYLRDGLTWIELEDMDQIVALEDGSFLDVDDMYVARLKVEWFYDNNLYGYNRHWWKDEEFCKISPFASYEDAIKDYEDMEYIVFVYKYDDEWYVCPERLPGATFMYKAEF